MNDYCALYEDMIMEKHNTFTAVQTNEGFQVMLNGSEKKMLELTFDDVNQFAYKYGLAQLNGKEIEMNEKNQLMLSILSMLLIPDQTVH